MRNWIFSILCALIPLGLIGVLYLNGLGLDGSAPILLLLLCPILHLLLHKGHGRRKGQESEGVGLAVKPEDEVR